MARHSLRLPTSKGRFVTRAAYHEFYRVKTEVVYRLERLARFELVRDLQNALYNGMEQCGTALTEFATRLEGGFSYQASSKLTRAHQELADAAREKMLEVYDSFRGRTESYRVSSSDPGSRRYAGGVLRRVLASYDFISSDRDGIYYGNRSDLNSFARQWQRLNFGAGDAGVAGGGARSFPVAGLVGVALGINGGVRPGFSLPHGYWRLNGGGPALAGGQGGNTFYPTGSRQVWPTAGIPAEHFLDAGVQVIAEGVVPAYVNVYQEILAESARDWY